LGFYDGIAPLTVEVNSNGSVLWSQIVTGDSINLQIPGSVFAGQLFADISIKPSGALMAAGIKTATSNMSAASSSSSEYDIAISKEFNYLDYPNIRVIILLPDSDVIRKFKPAIYAWLDCFVARGIPLSRIAILSNANVTEENIRLALIMGGGRRYVLYFGHGNSMADPNVQRTFIDAWSPNTDTPIVSSPFMSPFKKTYAFSYTRQRYSGADPLPNNWDNEGIDLSLRNLENSNKVEQMWTFGCKLGQFPDMAETSGMYSDWNMGHADQIYGGFKINILGESIGAIDTIIKGAVNGSIIMAETLGQHRSVQKALEAIQSSGTSNTVYWGMDGQIDTASGSDDNFRLYGSWLLDSMYIEP